MTPEQHAQRIIDTPEFKAWKEAECRLRMQRSGYAQALSHRNMRRAAKFKSGLRALGQAERAAYAAVKAVQS
jgi:hypothetical protein